MKILTIKYSKEGQLHRFVTDGEDISTVDVENGWECLLEEITRFGEIKISFPTNAFNVKFSKFLDSVNYTVGYDIEFPLILEIQP